MKHFPQLCGAGIVDHDDVGSLPSILEQVLMEGFPSGADGGGAVAGKDADSFQGDTGRGGLTFP
jgi:hypothetical protein